MTATWSPASLDELEARLRQDLRWLNLPPKSWVPPRLAEGGRVLDVAVIGGGLCGLAALGALKFLGVDNIRAFDRAPAGREGPWVTYARMETLRTRKEVAGPALGLPALSFRGWFESQFGPDAFHAMHLIPRTQWMGYLVWYRRVLDLPVENDAAVADVALRDDGLAALTVKSADAGRQVLARRVILATGLDGLGGPSLPPVARTIPSRFVAHAADDIDMVALARQRVGVVGAGASAMDNAAAALEAGAARVDIFVRRPDIPRVDKFTGIGSKGMTHGYFGLSDRVRWTLMLEGEHAQIPPPRHSVERVARHTNAYFHLASPIERLTEDGDSVWITTPKGEYPADFVIFATGFGIDFARRPEFGRIAPLIRLWRDVYMPDAADRHEGLGQTPYLGSSFEFLPRADAAPGARAISHIHCFAYPAVPSHGKITSGIPSISDGAQRLAQGIARSLFVEDEAAVIQAFREFTTPELLGDEWTDADQLPENRHAATP
ncbi:MAG: NAD(P)/FAD-dependent oxidoreductase [Devosia sp.]|nr:NAD(P)/FAD-dependent oxidoreductase [Devosia sp.]